VTIAFPNTRRLNFLENAMKTNQMSALSVLLSALMFSILTASNAIAKPVPINPQIDAPAFLDVAQDAMRHRESRRVSEQDFLRMSIEPGTLILDARSSEKYRELHLKGAVNLSFPDITAERLAQLIPNKNTRILIYCNNNFANAEKAFPTKLPSASLNLSTYAALYNYGYRNVYELGPFVDVKATKLALVAAQ
jgi:phage shock protein E